VVDEGEVVTHRKEEKDICGTRKGGMKGGRKKGKHKGREQR
jgi:hypothetical protein